MTNTWKPATATAAFTSLLFIVTYNACNYITGLRPDIGTWAFDWERHWPVVPFMIVPYWSIDLLFVIAPFLCPNIEAIRLLRRRLIIVIAGGALGFLLIPLEFAFPRPEVEGMFGPWFDALYSFDRPNNLFPSLHIALRTVLAVAYASYARGSWRWLAHAWFFLIGISTLLIWQHHIVDVLGGFWLAAMAIHLSNGAASIRFQPNKTVAIPYAILAVLATQLARIQWPWTFPFTWIAFAVGGAAFGYASCGNFYRKSHGQLSLATRALFYPMIAGQWASWWWYSRQSNAWDELTDRVWIGRLLTEKETERAVAKGVAAVLDLTVEFSEPKPFRTRSYLNLPILDLTAPTSEQLATASAFIEKESKSGVVYIHCKAGYSRSAAAAAAWLVDSARAADPESAFLKLKAVRSNIVIRPEIRSALAAYFGQRAAASVEDRRR